MGAAGRQGRADHGRGSGIGRATAERFAGRGRAHLLRRLRRRRGRAVADAVDGVFVHADAGDVERRRRRRSHACERELGGVDIAYLERRDRDRRRRTSPRSPTTVYRRIMRVNVDGVVFGHARRDPGDAAPRRWRDRRDELARRAHPVPARPGLRPDQARGRRASSAASRRRSGALGITANTVNPGMTDTNILSDDAKALFAANDFPLMPAEPRSPTPCSRSSPPGRTGECWVCQPGRDPEPYRFHDVPGPRSAGAEGRRPPGHALTAGRKSAAGRAADCR